MKRIGILTSGGDCPGLNAAIRGIAKAVYQEISDAEIIGITGGYGGLINNEYNRMKQEDFSGILTRGGTILGTSRQPYKLMQIVGDDNVNKVESMKNNYGRMGLNCLVVLGGNGTHKTANLLAEEGLNVIGLPKTIDNDIYGTDETFGFDTAVEIGTEVIDRLHSTAASHSRVMVVEMMGNKAGWLTLYTGVAGGADVIILPEIPYELDKINHAVEKRAKSGSVFSIINVAEGAFSKIEAGMKKKERLQKRIETNCTSAAAAIAKSIGQETGIETRMVVPGHMLRGGSPSAYDRVLTTRIGTYAANLIAEDIYGVTVAKKGSEITHNPLSEIAGKTRLVPENHQIVSSAQRVGISFGG